MVWSTCESRRIPDWLLGLAVAALLVPSASFLIWEPAKVAREWRIAVRKRTKYDYTRLTLWWQIWGSRLGELEKIGPLYGHFDFTDVPLEIKDWEPKDVDALVEGVLATLWELSAEAPLAHLERQADNARRKLRAFHDLTLDPDFYNQDAINDAGQDMLQAFRRLYRRDPVLSISGGSRRLGP
jgi:hypothetical protein